MQETTILTGNIESSANAGSPVQDAHESLKIEWRADGQLLASRNGSEQVVRITRCFPWSQPDRYVSLRDDDENEVALIDNLTDLDEDSRKAIVVALAEAGFVLEIEKVIAIMEDFEIRSWEVMTRQGPRKFQTALDDWPIAVPGGALVIRDVSGDLFFIDDPEALDEPSRKLLWAFVG